mmetsp:Transcript_25102/g.24566  ORF Transcript_25102/g.24566 Transcript_25102/m.24566 type:complete len:269 (-) Transcript_25102:859-1665(-)
MILVIESILLLLMLISVIASYRCFLVSMLLHSLTNPTIVSYIWASSSLKNMSELERAMWEYWRRAKAAPFVGQSCLWSTRISLSSLITSLDTMCSVMSSLSTLQVRLRTMPIIRSLNLLRYTLLGDCLGTFLLRASSSSLMMTAKRSFSLMSWATFSMQFSLAVRSRRTVAAGYLTWMRSVEPLRKRSTISMTCFRNRCRTLMPSGWQAQSSKTLATSLYSWTSSGRLTITLMRPLKMSALMNHSDRLSYISRSLKSSTMSITAPIRL